MSTPASVRSRLWYLEAGHFELSILTDWTAIRRMLGASASTLLEGTNINSVDSGSRGRCGQRFSEDIACCRFSAGRDPSFSKPFPPDLSSRLSARHAPSGCPRHRQAVDGPAQAGHHGRRNLRRVASFTKAALILGDFSIALPASVQKPRRSGVVLACPFCAAGRSSRSAADDSQHANNREPQILVVEDDDANREFLRALLESEGFLVATASDGREALIWLNDHPSPDLVLLDLEMPRMSGWEFLGPPIAPHGLPVLAS